MLFYSAFLELFLGRLFLDNTELIFQHFVQSMSYVQILRNLRNWPYGPLGYIPFIPLHLLKSLNKSKVTKETPILKKEHK